MFVKTSKLHSSDTKIEVVDIVHLDTVTGRVPPQQSKIVTLVNLVDLLQRKFTYCNPSLVARNDIKFTFKYAGDAIVSQIIWAEETSKGNLETCNLL